MNRQEEIEQALADVGMDADTPVAGLIRHHRNNAGVAAALGAQNEIVAKLKPLLQEALVTDGEHHKQWFLEQIAEALMLDRVMPEHDPGIVP